MRPRQDAPVSLLVPRMVPTHLRRTPTGALRVGLVSPLPDPLNVGAGTAIVVSGWCYHDWLAIRHLRIQCGQSVVPVALSGIPHPELSNGKAPGAASAAFAAVLPIADVVEPVTEPIVIQAALAGGRTESATIGILRLNSSHAQAEAENAFSGSSSPSVERMGVRRRPYAGGEDAPSSPTFAICLATSNPSTDFFARQIAAFRGQTESNWICLVNDDGSKPESFAAIRGMLGDDRRFLLIRQSTKRGHPCLIENCLAQVPSEAEFVALCGSRDIWQRNALAVLRSRIAPRTSLVCTSATSGDLSELLVSDLSLGTAMFRRSVLDRILPFPPAVAGPRSNAWIAGVCAIAGKVTRVAEPLCETIPTSPPADADPPPRLPLKARLVQWLADGPRQFAEHGLRIQQLVQALRLRGGGRLSRTQCQAIDRVVDPLWLLMQSARDWLGRNQTPGKASAVLHGQLCPRLYALSERSVLAESVRADRRPRNAAPREPINPTGPCHEARVGTFSRLRAGHRTL